MNTNTEVKKFYHGTSTAYEIDSDISPLVKDSNPKTLYKRKTAKIQVTTNLLDAKYFADKCAYEKGGDPIIYEVQPDSFTMVRVNKTSYRTAHAKILGVVDMKEVEQLLQESSNDDK